MFVVDPTDGSKFWVRVQEGKLESDGEAMPYAGRVDVQVAAGKEREVKWLRLITGEIDHVSLCRHCIGSWLSEIGWEQYDMFWCSRYFSLIPP